MNTQELIKELNTYLQSNNRRVVEKTTYSPEELDALLPLHRLFEAYHSFVEDSEGVSDQTTQWVEDNFQSHILNGVKYYVHKLGVYEKVLSSEIYKLEHESGLMCYVYFSPMHTDTLTENDRRAQQKDATTRAYRGVLTGSESKILNVLTTLYCENQIIHTVYSNIYRNVHNRVRELDMNSTCKDIQVTDPYKLLLDEEVLPLIPIDMGHIYFF